VNPGPLIMSILRREKSLADCTRRQVGAVLVKDGIIVGKGHNRLPDGSCTEGHCPRGQMSYAEQPPDIGYAASGCFSDHAEDAALRDAGDRAVGAIAYVSEWPCARCYVTLKDAGVIGFIRVELPGEGFQGRLV
jgi:dCMP deaminase